MLVYNNCLMVFEERYRKFCFKIVLLKRLFFNLVRYLFNIYFSLEKKGELLVNV